MSDERPTEPVHHSMKSKDLDLEQQIADEMWTMGEGEWRDRHGD